MPIFDYQCQACGHGFDALQKISDPVLTDCPECGEHELKKLLSAPNFHLKGGGWRKSEPDTKTRPGSKPRIGHMFDSPVPHAEHDDHDHGHTHGPDHGHDHGQ